MAASYVDRMVTELADLQTKSKDLEAFLATPTFQTLEVQDRTLMGNQLMQMRGYEAILTERIRRAK